MGEVVNFPIGPILNEQEDMEKDLSVQILIDGLINNNVVSGMFIGRTEDNTFYVASTSTNIGKLLVWLEGAKEVVVSQIDISLPTADE